MAAKLQSRWQQIKKHPVLSIGITLIVLIVLGVTIILVANNGTGFDAYSTTTTSKITSGTTNPVVTSTVVNQPGKTLWDWLQLLGILAIPAVVGFGAAWFTTKQAKANDAENKDNQRETALQAYIDKMSELLLKEHLGEPKSEYAGVRVIARARTLTVLRRLDAERKGSVLRFLQESRLIDKKMYIIDLDGADLSGADLSGVYLRNTFLRGANLTGADMTYTYLTGADMNRAKLSHANLSGADMRIGDDEISVTNLTDADLSSADVTDANLNGAFLCGALLIDANLTNADLTDADLTYANLSRAKVLSQQLDKVRSLKNATMPDGSEHP